MGLVINHNMMAMGAARNLSTVYSALGKSMQRLSSGLRINSAADDAAGLAIRELMRADIQVIRQGVRNASDGISLIQTAEGALSVIDEKLIRMKELAEQAATGTYTTVQRQIMNSEYQAMAAEIDRIATATSFNGIKMLNGSMATANNGSGLKIHFGTGNSANEDYYFIKIDDVRATTELGLAVGTSNLTNILPDADIWRNDNGVAATGGVAVSATDGYLAFAFDRDASRTAGSAVSTELENIVGIYEVDAADGGSGSYDLDDLVAAINQGTAARVSINFGITTGGELLQSALGLVSGGVAAHIEVGNVKIAYTHLSGSTVDADVDASYSAASLVTQAQFAAHLASAINAADGNVFAVHDGTTSGQSITVFAKEAGALGNGYAAWENIGSAGAATVTFVGTGISTANSASTGTFSDGGSAWVTATAVQGADGNYHLQITANSGGAGRDLLFFEAASASAYNGGGIVGAPWIGTLTGYDAEEASEWVETQDASAASTYTVAGRNILTQSAAQLALDALKTAIERKDTTRASLGAFQNRLENTITQLTIQAENLQASESRISDVDVAYEMTEFTKNMILVQAATSMLAQANSIAQIALSLLQ